MGSLLQEMLLASQELESLGEDWPDRTSAHLDTQIFAWYH